MRFLNHFFRCILAVSISVGLDSWLHMPWPAYIAVVVLVSLVVDIALRGYE